MTDSDAFPWLDAGVPGRQRIELTVHIVVPLILPHGWIFHGRKVGWHHEVVPVTKVGAFIVFVFRVATKGEHVVVLWERLTRAWS